MVETTLILDGRGLVELPRWHDGHFWFADWTAGEILRLGADGSAEVMARAAAPPLSFDFARDGRMLIVAAGERRLLRREADGRVLAFAELGDGSTQGFGWNEIVVDGRGNAYVNGPKIMLVRPEGTTSAEAEDFAFPNGMAVTPDNATLIIAESWAERLTAFDIAADGRLSRRRVWAATPGDHPDGICLDDTGAAWYADVGGAHCRRVREGGEITGEVALDRGAFACVLGGPQRRTMLITAARWFGMDRMAEMAGAGQVLTCPCARRRRRLAVATSSRSPARGPRRRDWPRCGC